MVLSSATQRSVCAMTSSVRFPSVAWSRPPRSVARPGRHPIPWRGPGAPRAARRARGRQRRRAGCAASGLSFWAARQRRDESQQPEQRVSTDLAKEQLQEFISVRVCFGVDGAVSGRDRCGDGRAFTGAAPDHRRGVRSRRSSRGLEGRPSTPYPAPARPPASAVPDQRV